MIVILVAFPGNSRAGVDKRTLLTKERSSFVFAPGQGLAKEISSFAAVNHLWGGEEGKMLNVAIFTFLGKPS